MRVPCRPPAAAACNRGTSCGTREASAGTRHRHWQHAERQCRAGRQLGTPRTFVSGSGTLAFAPASSSTSTMSPSMFRTARCNGTSPDSATCLPAMCGSSATSRCTAPTSPPCMAAKSRAVGVWTTALLSARTAGAATLACVPAPAPDPAPATARTRACSARCRRRCSSMCARCFCDTLGAGCACCEACGATGTGAGAGAETGTGTAGAGNADGELSACFGPGATLAASTSREADTDRLLEVLHPMPTQDRRTLGLPTRRSRWDIGAAALCALDHRIISQRTCTQKNAGWRGD